MPTHPLRDTLLVMACAFAAHASGLFGGFLGWDDFQYIAANPIVTGPAGDAFVTAFAGPYFGNYHPLHVLSYRLDFALFGSAPFGYHLFNVLYFTGAAGLVAAFLRRAFPGERFAFWAALLFAVHPAHVESVAWLSARKDVLALLFGALYALCHLRATAAPTRAKALGFALLGLLSFAAALLSKAIVAPLPVALFAYDLLVARRPFGRAILILVPALALAAGELAVAWRAQADLGWIHPLPGGDYFGAAIVTVSVLARYLGILAAPVQLSAIYEVAPPDATDPAFLFSLALLLGLAALILYGLRRGERIPLWCAIFFLGMLSPVTPFTPLTHLMADRYLLFPSLAFCVLLAWTLARAAARLAMFRRFTTSIVIGLCVVWMALAATRGLDWHDDVRLWTDAVAKAPTDVTAQMNFASALANRGELRSAAVAYARTLDLAPGHARARANLKRLAADLERRGDHAGATLAMRLLNEGTQALRRP